MFEFPVVLLLSAFVPLAVLSSPVVLLLSVDAPIAVFLDNAPPPFPTVIPLAIKSLLNVLEPAKVCVPLVTIPPLVPSAGARVNVAPLIEAPLAVEDPAILPTVVTAVVGVDQLATPLPFVVKT